MAASDIVPQELSVATRACRQSFTECLSIRGLMEDEWAENRLADFNLWDAGVGASAHPLASLDRRLMSQPEAYAIVHGAQTEADQEHDATSLVDATDNDSENGSAQSSSSSTSLDRLPSQQERTPSRRVPLTDAIEDVESVLDQLIRVGFAIRKFGTNARLQKADASFNPDDYDNFRQHLSLMLLVDQAFRLFANVTDDKTKDANLRSFIQTLVLNVDALDDRQRSSINHSGPNPHLLSLQVSKEQKNLIHANLRRRHRFVSARRHGKKLAYRTVPQAPETDSERPEVQPARPSGTVRSGNTAAPEGNALKHARNLASMAATSVSAGTVRFNQESLQIPRPAPQTATVISTTVQKLEYPRPPPVIGLMGFTCPCCLQTLPAALAERNRWRKHVSEDLAPYTCPFPSCPTPAVFYKTKDAWKSHLFQDHCAAGYWDCMACSKAGQPLTFPSVIKFELHTTQEHGDAVSATQLATLRRISHRTSPPPLEFCPLCYFRPVDKTGAIIVDDLIDHVGDHIHDFSLESLPWAQDQSRPLHDKSVESWFERLDRTVTTDEGEELDLKLPDDKDIAYLNTSLGPAEEETEPGKLFIRSEYFDEAGSQKTSNAQMGHNTSNTEGASSSTDDAFPGTVPEVVVDDFDNLDPAQNSVQHQFDLHIPILGPHQTIAPRYPRSPSSARRQLAARLARHSQIPEHEQDEVDSESQSDNLCATEDNDYNGLKTDEAEQHPPLGFGDFILWCPCDDWKADGHHWSSVRRSVLQKWLSMTKTNTQLDPLDYVPNNNPPALDEAVTLARTAADGTADVRLRSLYLHNLSAILDWRALFSDGRTDPEEAVRVARNAIDMAAGQRELRAVLLIDHISRLRRLSPYDIQREAIEATELAVLAIPEEPLLRAMWVDLRDRILSESPPYRVPPLVDRPEVGVMMAQSQAPASDFASGNSSSSPLSADPADVNVQENKTVLNSDDKGSKASSRWRNVVNKVFGRPTRPENVITQKIEYVEKVDKYSALLEKLRSGLAPSTLVFVETEAVADSLCDFLSNRGFSAVAYHGGTFPGFGPHAIVVVCDDTTSTVHLPKVSEIISYDAPNGIHTYASRLTHVAPTQRPALATTFFNQDNVSISRELVNTLIEARQEVPGFLKTIARESEQKNDPIPPTSSKPSLSTMVQPDSYPKKSLYKFGKSLGVSTNIVLEAEINSTRVAVKIIPKKSVQGEQEEFHQRIRLLRTLRHPNIAEFLDWFESRDKFYIVTQLGTGGELIDRIVEQGRLTERDAIGTMKQALDVVNYLHGRDIVHRGLCPEKFVYESKEYFRREQDSKLLLVGFYNVKFVQAHENLNDMFGSFGYAAPEIMLKQGYGKPADMWSLGVITYTLLCGYSPWRSDTLAEMAEECRIGPPIFHERYWNDISESSKDFIMTLLQPDPKRRASAQEALEHPWIKGGGGISDHLPVPSTRSHIVKEKFRKGIRLVMLANRIETLKGQDDFYESVFREVVWAKIREHRPAERLD
ncbi:Calmodulin-dependent protein kinase cmk2 [Exophiala xenobiotica]|nr:Calmodulin-dependent protein kinase cmk2 [Exophiala xenobiotica]